MKAALGIEVHRDNGEAVRGAEMVILEVKPQNMDAVARGLAPVLEPHQVLVSVATGATTSYLQDRLAGPQPVVRAMPNTPAVINEGMTGLCPGLYAKPRHLAMAESVFSSVVRTAAGAGGADREPAGGSDTEVDSHPIRRREILPYLPLVVSSLLIAHQAIFARSRLNWQSLVIGSLISVALVVRQMLPLRGLRRFSGRWNRW